jgi:hypothetical protein
LDRTRISRSNKERADSNHVRIKAAKAKADFLVSPHIANGTRVIDWTTQIERHSPFRLTDSSSKHREASSKRVENQRMLKIDSEHSMQRCSNSLFG